MAWNNVRRSQGAIAASALAQYVVVTPDTSTDNQVFTAGSANVDAIGVVFQATVPTYGYAVNVAIEGEVKCYVAASVGAGARVSVASANGAIGPAVYPAAAPSGAAAGRLYSIGRIIDAAAAGDLATIVLDPREIV